MAHFSNMYRGNRETENSVTFEQMSVRGPQNAHHFVWKVGNKWIFFCIDGSIVWVYDEIYICMSVCIMLFVALNR